MTAAEQVWFGAMISQDIKEDFEEKLSFIEYLASFSNPEAVNKIIEQRKQGRPPTDEEFSQMISRQFGREVKLPPKQKERMGISN